VSQTIHLGLSTCPNDTFTFHGLIEKKVDWRGLSFEVELLDVQQLNQRLFSGQFDVAKASFHAALLMTEELGVLPSGSALGFGVGPLLLAARAGMDPDAYPDAMPRIETSVDETPLDETPVDEIQADETRQDAAARQRTYRVLCPGEHTTATLLYHLFHGGAGHVEQVVFSEIMPALQRGEADFGVCIHEGRFTWEQEGLALVEDLGTRWEQATATPLPLGGILARRRLGQDTLRRVAGVIRDSLEYGLTHRPETVTTMKRHAQDLSEDVMFAHVDLYVNDWTVDLGSVGQNALERLSSEAARAGILAPGLKPLEIVGR
jgi:1,4-dihydroxy-6-naphthoate synthase